MRKRLQNLERLILRSDKPTEKQGQRSFEVFDTTSSSTDARCCNQECRLVHDKIMLFSLHEIVALMGMTSTTPLHPYLFGSPAVIDSKLKS